MVRLAEQVLAWDLVRPLCGAYQGAMEMLHLGGQRATVNVSSNSRDAKEERKVTRKWLILLIMIVYKQFITERFVMNSAKRKTNLMSLKEYSWGCWISLALLPSDLSVCYPLIGSSGLETLLERAQRWCAVMEPLDFQPYPGHSSVLILGEKSPHHKEFWINIRIWATAHLPLP